MTFYNLRVISLGKYFVLNFKCVFACKLFIHTAKYLTTHNLDNHEQIEFVAPRINMSYHGVIQTTLSSFTKYTGMSHGGIKVSKVDIRVSTKVRLNYNQRKRKIGYRYDFKVSIL